MNKIAMVVGFLMGVQAVAQESTYFVARNQAYCKNSDPEFTAWFFNQTQSIPKIHEILGPVRDQGPSGQCYALTAADLIAAHTKMRVSGAQIAHLYYQKSLVGNLQRLFGSNFGGFTASAINATEGQKLCIEEQPVTLTQDPDPNSQAQFCPSPKFVMKSVSMRGYTTRGIEAGHQIFAPLDELLNRKKIVGIYYRAQLVFPGFNVSALNTFANHASSIVARQWNPQTNTCDYVIRNSWGERCTPVYGLCNRGYYSVPEAYIDKSVQKIDFIQ